MVMMYVKYPLSLRNVEDLLAEFTHWPWHFDEVHLQINGQMHFPWRDIDHASEVQESFASKTRGKSAALKFMKKLMKRHGRAALAACTYPNIQLG